VCAPARAPRSRLTAAAGPLGMSMGTVIGRTRRGPFSFRVSQALSSVQTPPMPVAKATARRSWSISSMPASFQASRAATTANCVEGSMRLSSTRDRTSPAGDEALAAKCTGSEYCSTHSSVKVWAPETPFRALAQRVGTSPPIGVVAPRPVITTLRAINILSVLDYRWRAQAVPPEVVVGRPAAAGGPPRRPGLPGSAAGATAGRARPGSGLGVGDEVHGVADGLEVLDFLVRDLHIELLFGVDDDGHHGDGVDVEVVREGLVQLNRVGGQAGLFVDDLGKAGQDFFVASHEAPFLSCRDSPDVYFPPEDGELLCCPVNSLGQDDDLRAEDEARAETDLKGQGARELGALLQHAVH